MSYKKKFKIGSLELDSNIIYAPLAEYTDYSFRKLIRNYHKGLIFCEMIKMEALIRKKSCNLLKYTKDMHPIGAQLCGVNPDVAIHAARIIEDLGFDIIDLNCGCPVPKVVKDGSGSALLKTPKLIYEILSNIKKTVSIPVTVKIRLGWDDNSIIAKEMVKIAQDAGCSAITIHGRTRAQRYSGISRWEYIKECKDVSNNILVIGNGDLNNIFQVKKIFDQTNCDGVMLARGILTNPQMSKDIESLYLFQKQSFFDRKAALLKYINYLLEEKESKKAILDLRRISGWMLRDVANIKHLRIAINASASTEEAIAHINNFNWDEKNETT